MTDLALVHETRQEKGGWQECVHAVRANESSAGKFSFKNLEAHAEDLSLSLAVNTTLRYLDLSCNNFSPV